MLRPERPAPAGRRARVLLVSGSPTDVSRSDVLLRHVSALLVGRGHVVEHLTLRERPAIEESLRQLAAADGVVLTSPVQTTDPDLLQTWLAGVPAHGFGHKVALPLAVDSAWSDALHPVLESLGAGVAADLETFLHFLAGLRRAAA